MESLTKSPTAMRITLRRNGTRQPQVRSASPERDDIRAKAPVPSTRPAGTPICGQLALRPRLRSGACSTAMSTAPPHSPPRPMTDALHDPQRQQHGGRPQANLAVGWEQTYGEGRYAHDEQRQHEHLLPPDPVAEMPEDETAYRPGNE